VLGHQQEVCTCVALSMMLLMAAFRYPDSRAFTDPLVVSFACNKHSFDARSELGAQPQKSVRFKAHKVHRLTALPAAGPICLPLYMAHIIILVQICEKLSRTLVSGDAVAQ